MALTPTKAAVPPAPINIKNKSLKERKQVKSARTYTRFLFVCLFCILLVLAVLKRQGEWQGNGKLRIQNDNCLERGMLYLPNF